MRISTIAFANLKRRKGKAVFLTIGIAIGIGTAVALLSLSSSIKEEIGSQLDRFGANIVVVPQSNSLSLDYGGLSVSSVSFDVKQLKNEDANSVLDIPFRNRISNVSPKLLGAVGVNGREILLAGVDFDSELTLKRWWHVAGRNPEGQQELLVGYEVARALSLIEPASQAGEQHVSHGGSHESSEDQFQFKIIRDRVKIADQEHTVAGVISQTGPLQRLVFGEYHGRRTERVASFLEACRRGGINAEISDDIRRSLWEKYVVLVAMSGATTAMRSSIGPIRTHPLAREFLLDLAREVVVVGRAHGVKLPTDYAEQRVPFFDGWPPEMTTSMHHDLNAGKPLEVRWLAGGVVDLGARVGVPTPLNRAVRDILILHAAGGTHSHAAQPS